LIFVHVVLYPKQFKAEIIMGCGSSCHREPITSELFNGAKRPESRANAKVLVLDDPANAAAESSASGAAAATKPARTETDGAIDDCRDAAVTDFASYLGIDPVAEAELLWIARAAIASRPPPPWQQLETEDGRPYFVHGETRRTQWEHPLDGYHRALLLLLRDQGSEDQRSVSAAAAAAAASVAAETAAADPPPAAQACGARQAAALHARARLILRAGRAAHERDEARARARLAAAARAIARGGPARPGPAVS
jgi:hypothetical protein